MILFKDSHIASKAQILRDHGMSIERRYWHEIIGYNYRLTNMQAALGVAQMERLPQILKAKIRISEYYSNKLKTVEGISLLPSLNQDIVHSNWLYGIVLDDCLNRDQISCSLLQRN